MLRICFWVLHNGSNKKKPYRSPVDISAAAASLTLSSVSLFNVPSSSLMPYRPHAECGGSPILKGRSSKAGMPLELSLGATILCNGRLLAPSSFTCWDQTDAGLG